MGLIQPRVMDCVIDELPADNGNICKDGFHFCSFHIPASDMLLVEERYPGRVYL